MEWQTNATLQLQRLAHEASGYGNWPKADGQIPVTQTGDKLAILDTGNPNHPRLRRASTLNVVTSKMQPDGKTATIYEERSVWIAEEFVARKK
jgi:hypothetical protein